ncbi:MAG: low molecular weight protein-tyrosine-phosphatase [Candidatus Bruticola sp.]
MIKILFVCHGNICRSPMAEFAMKNLVARHNLEGVFFIESAAVSSEELHNPVYMPVRRLLAQQGLDCSGKRARLMTKSDYNAFDYIIGMDHSNMSRMRKICGGDPENKLSLLMDYTDRPGDVADPWYTRNFDTAWQDISLGCQALLDRLIP